MFRDRFDLFIKSGVCVFFVREWAVGAFTRKLARVSVCAIIMCYDAIVNMVSRKTLYSMFCFMIEPNSIQLMSPTIYRRLLIIFGRSAFVLHTHIVRFSYFVTYIIF